MQMKDDYTRSLLLIIPEEIFIEIISHLHPYLDDVIKLVCRKFFDIVKNKIPYNLETTSIKMITLYENIKNGRNINREPGKCKKLFYKIYHETFIDPAFYIPEIFINLVKLQFSNVASGVFIINLSFLDKLKKLKKMKLYGDIIMCSYVNDYEKSNFSYILKSNIKDICFYDNTKLCEVVKDNNYLEYLNNKINNNNINRIRIKLCKFEGDLIKFLNIFKGIVKINIYDDSETKRLLSEFHGIDKIIKIKSNSNLIFENIYAKNLMRVSLVNTFNLQPIQDLYIPNFDFFDPIKIISLRIEDYKITVNNFDIIKKMTGLIKLEIIDSSFMDNMKLDIVSFLNIISKNNLKLKKINIRSTRFYNTFSDYFFESEYKDFITKRFNNNDKIERFLPSQISFKDVWNDPKVLLDLFKIKIFHNLTYLDLSYISYKYMNNTLSHLNKLKVLRMGNNCKLDISFLGDLTCKETLNELYIDNIKITNSMENIILINDFKNLIILNVAGTLDKSFLKKICLNNLEYLIIKEFGLEDFYSEDMIEVIKNNPNLIRLNLLNSFLPLFFIENFREELRKMDRFIKFERRVGNMGKGYFIEL